MPSNKRNPVNPLRKFNKATIQIISLPRSIHSHNKEIIQIKVRINRAISITFQASAKYPNRLASI